MAHLWSYPLMWLQTHALLWHHLFAVGPQNSKEHQGTPEDVLSDCAVLMCCLSNAVPREAAGDLYLVVNDAPGVGDHVVVVPSKGMIAGPRSAKAVTHHLHPLLLLFMLCQLLPDIICCQRRQGPTQRMPCNQTPTCCRKCVPCNKWMEKS